MLKNIKKNLHMSEKSSTFAPDLKIEDILSEKNRHLGGFENDQILRKKTNLFCTLNKQTNTLEKQASRRRLFSLLKGPLNYIKSRLLPSGGI